MPTSQQAGHLGNVHLKHTSFMGLLNREQIFQE